MSLGNLLNRKDIPEDVKEEIRKNISETKRADENLKESHNKFLNLASNIPAYIAYVNADTLKYEFVNDRFEQSFGIPKERIIGSHIKDIIGETNYQFALKYINEVKSGKAISYENSFDLVSGRRWIQVNYTPIFDSCGRITSIAVLSYDITERRRAEEELKEREKHSQSLLRLSRNMEWAQTYTAILNAALDEVKEIIGYQSLAAYLLTEDKKYFKVLAAGGTITDTDMSEFGTATLTIKGDKMLEEIAEAKEIVVVEDAQNDDRVDKEIVAKLGFRTIVNVPIILFDRHLGTISMGTYWDAGVRVPTSSERKFLIALASHMAVSLDRIRLLNERKKVEKELIESNNQLEKTLVRLEETQRQVLQHERLRSLGQMASGIAHDINNSLTPIIGYIDLLRKKEEIIIKNKDTFDKIIKSAKRIASTVGRLKSFYKMKIDEEKLSEIDIGKLINQSIEFTSYRWKDIAESTGSVIKIKTEFQMDLPITRMDESEMMEALTNLIINVCDAMPNGGILTFRTFQKEDNIVIELMDTG